MPISPILLQRRHAELGRIRLGDKGDRGQPQKLNSFRFTSHSERYIRDLAELYGGTPKPWDNNGVPSWEVYSTAKSIPVIAVKGGLSQWMEFWAAGGCIHRCDGETNMLTGEACDLNEQVQVGKKVINPHNEAKPTTRLSLMLVELEAIGVWRMESHGWNAAAEIPAVAELAQFVGDLVPANLHLVERRSIKDGKTSRFVVPVLDLQIGTARLKQLVAERSGAPLELATPSTSDGPAAIASARPDYEGQADEATSLDEVRSIWAEAAERGHLDNDLKAYLTDAGNALNNSGPLPNPDGTYDAEVVDDGTLWQQILTVAAEKRGWVLDQVTEDFKLTMGILAADANTDELAKYLHTLSTGEEPAA